MVLCVIQEIECFLKPLTFLSQNHVCITGEYVSAFDSACAFITFEPEWLLLAAREKRVALACVSMSKHKTCASQDSFTRQHVSYVSLIDCGC